MAGSFREISPVDPDNLPWSISMGNVGIVVHNSPVLQLFCGGRALLFFRGVESSIIGVGRKCRGLSIETLGEEGGRGNHNFNTNFSRKKTWKKVIDRTKDALMQMNVPQYVMKCSKGSSVSQRWSPPKSGGSTVRK